MHASQSLNMNIFKIIKYQLYLLQLEEYELGRYFKLLLKKSFLPKGEQRKSLVWTAKVKILFVLSELLILAGSYWVSYLLFLNVFENTVLVSIIFFSIFFLLHFFGFVFLSVSVFLLSPVDLLVKSVIVFRAKSKILNLKSTITIIGVAGSYGKTTMKEMLKTVLSTQKSVQSTPESVNTPVGISRWILKNLNESTEILIIEMGEHYKGDIKEICEIAKPDISIVTGINEAHLERMKSLETITQTIFEIVESLKPKGLAVLNADNKNVLENYKKYIWPDHKVVFYSGLNPKSQILNPRFNSEKLGWEMEVEGVGQVFVNLLGEYTLGNVDAVVKIAKKLGLSSVEIKKGLETIRAVSHRLEPIKSSGNVLVIDDAYNGNPAGVKEAIKVLSRFENRRKVFITPGLVETGSSVKEIHLEIGRQLAGVADVVVLIKNSVTPYIEEGVKNYELRMEQDNKLKTKNYKLPAIIWFNTAQEAHESLKNILKPNDVVLFQNDWGDQYI
jgi:UDP-N-acetylmuramoyl-tripeptide--D-alanyl-D-alanine ligase